MAAVAHSEIDLFSNSEVFCFRPKNTKETLTLSRQNGEFTPHDKDFESYVGLKHHAHIYGIVGLIRLLRGLYLITIADRSLVGHIDGHPIWKLKRVEFLPLREDTRLSSSHESDERTYLELLNSQFNGSRAWYYSYSMDMTRSIQNIQRKPKQENSLWRNAETSFFWNYFLVKELRVHQLDGWIIPIIRGFCEILLVKVNGQPFTFALISRGSHKRAGTRYNMRGVDEQGNVANFAETEQIVIASGGAIASFVQVRGSIPIFWSQYSNLKYKPKPTIEKATSPDNVRKLGFVNHMQYLLDRYSKVYIVNLVNQHGSEKTLANEYHENVRSFNSNDIRYVAFDFHKECKGMRFDRVDILVRKVQTELGEYDYFFRNADGEIQKTQKGVFRNNCIDSLDRTNVVQSAFAKFVLKRQLTDLNILNQGEELSDHKQFNAIFNNCWADNADAMSVLYAGTGALKTDFTRVGTRTYGGLFNDGYNSVVRYFLNNFRDGHRQDAINLVVGNFVPDTSLPSPFAGQSGAKLVSVLTFGLFAGMAMTLANAVLLVRSMTSATDAETNAGHRALFMAAWGLFMWVTYALLMRNGRDLVDKPRLVEPKKLI